MALVRKFAETRSGAFPRLIVLGSTSAYAYTVPVETIDRPPPWLDESAPVDHSLPRIQGEEYLRNHHGAMVLRVAGIYGPGRHPLDWIRQGRVGVCNRYVNLIHVTDLAGICLAMLREGAPAEIYNVSDGMPRTWADICRTLTERWRIMALDKRADRHPGKRISSQKLQHTLSYRLKYPDLFEALAAIEPPPLFERRQPGSMKVSQDSRLHLLPFLSRVPYRQRPVNGFRCNLVPIRGPMNIIREVGRDSFP